MPEAGDPSAVTDPRATSATEPVVALFRILIVQAAASTRSEFSTIPEAIWELEVMVSPVRAACTKAVVASCVVLVPGAAVGAAGVPVKVGLARFATWAPPW